MAFDLQAHRGGRGFAPENTLAAFRQAVTLGVTTLVHAAPLGLSAMHQLGGVALFLTSLTFLRAAVLDGALANVPAHVAPGTAAAPRKPLIAARAPRPNCSDWRRVQSIVTRVKDTKTSPPL